MFEVIVNGVAVATLESGKSFGELALLYNTPRAATVYALTNCVVYALDRDTFRNTLANTSFSKVRGAVLSLLPYFCFTLLCFHFPWLTVSKWNAALSFYVKSFSTVVCRHVCFFLDFLYHFMEYCHLHSLPSTSLVSFTTLSSMTSCTVYLFLYSIFSCVVLFLNKIYLFILYFLSMYRIILLIFGFVISIVTFWQHTSCYWTLNPCYCLDVFFYLADTLFLLFLSLLS